MPQKDFTVLNHLGLHARPAARFVQCALGYKCTVKLWVRGNAFDGKSIMDLLISNLDQGATFTLETEGPDAEVAITRLEALLKELQFEDD